MIDCLCLDNIKVENAARQVNCQTIQYIKEPPSVMFFYFNCRPIHNLYIKLKNFLELVENYIYLKV